MRAIIRARIWRPKMPDPDVVEINGPSPFATCEKTGKMYVIETGEPVETITWTELLALHPHECPMCNGPRQTAES